MQTLTPTLVAQIFQCKQSRADAVFDELVATMEIFDITDPAAITCYLVQTDWESGGMQYFSELGPESYFMHYDINGDDPSLAKDLGNVNPGDGYQFRGSGPIQLTGRNNFFYAQQAMDAAGIKGPDGGPLDITTLPNVYVNGVGIQGPDLARTDRYAFGTSAWWWKAHGGNDVAHRQPLSYASLCCGRMVNRGDADSSSPAQGEQGRIEAFNRIAGFGQLQLPTVKPVPPTPPAVTTVLEDIMADPAAEDAFAQKIVDKLLAHQEKRVVVHTDPVTKKVTETQELATFKEMVWGGSTTMANRLVNLFNYVKNQAAKIR